MLPSDALLVVMCFYLAYLFRFEFAIPPNELSTFARTWPNVLIVKMVVFALFHLYRGMWRYTSMRDLINVSKAVFTSSLLINVINLTNRFIAGVEASPTDFVIPREFSTRPYWFYGFDKNFMKLRYQ